MKIGLIHTRGLGDVVVAIPLAYWFIRQGHEVYWPIDRRFIRHFDERCPEIRFLPVDPADPSAKPNGAKDGDPMYFFHTPRMLLQEAGCERMHVLYHRMLMDPKLAPLSQALHFDQMKYALADVPFNEKWNLRNCIRRFPARERALYNQVVQSEPFGLIHLEASDQVAPEDTPRSFCGGLPIVRITEGDATIFDWLMVLERASAIAMIDSVFSNIVEQLSLSTRKLFIIKHSGWQPPVLRAHWQFAWNAPAPVAAPEVDNGLIAPEVPGSLDRAASDKSNS